MDTKDLMLGDWVFYRNNPYYVQAIESNGMVRIIPSDMADVLSRTTWPDKITPIPLTPEILEKNGFECRGAWCLPGEDLGLRQDGDSLGLLSDYVEYDALAFCHIKYVHELQHSLHLCGIEKEITI